MSPIVATILAGGAGTRLWPLSRPDLPKQFLSIDASGVSMLDQTVSRLEGMVGKENVTVVTSRVLVAGVANEMLRKYNLILEPCARNTAPAIGVAALQQVLLGLDPIMIVLPADHLIIDVGEFHRCLRKAIAAAELGDLVIFGIVPTAPETGFGYIKADPISGAGELADVLAFTEKPPLETAKRFVAEGAHFWNSGMFVWKASAVLEAIRVHLPSVADTLGAIRRDTIAGTTFAEAVQTHFSSAPAISIDHGVLEKLASQPSTNGGSPSHRLRLKVVPAAIGWNDIGSWDAVYETAEKDPAQNVTRGNNILINSVNTLVHAGKRLVAAVGVENLLIVDTPDAILIVKRGESQQVRLIVDALTVNAEVKPSDLAKSKPHINRAHVTPVLVDEEGFKIERINLEPGTKIPIQNSPVNPGHWLVATGIASITTEDGSEVSKYSVNQHFRLLGEQRYQLANSGATRLTIIAIQIAD